MDRAGGTKALSVKQSRQQLRLLPASLAHKYLTAVAFAASHVVP